MVHEKISKNSQKITLKILRLADENLKKKGFTEAENVQNSGKKLVIFQ